MTHDTRNDEVRDGEVRDGDTRKDAARDGARPPDTRTRLVDAARELFWRKGYHGASVAEILERAGANSGSLYHFFPTKQHLLLAVLEWYVENLEPQIVEPARARTDDPLGRVFAILAGYRRALLATDFHFGCPIGNLALEFKEPDPPVRELLARNFDGWCEAVATSLAEAFERELDGRAPEDRLPEDLDTGACCGSS